jgi:hypothetical protein
MLGCGPTFGCTGRTEDLEFSALTPNPGDFPGEGVHCFCKRVMNIYSRSESKFRGLCKSPGRVDIRKQRVAEPVGVRSESTDKGRFREVPAGWGELVEEFHRVGIQENPRTVICVAGIAGHAASVFRPLAGFPLVELPRLIVCEMQAAIADRPNRIPHPDIFKISGEPRGHGPATFFRGFVVLDDLAS